MQGQQEQRQEQGQRRKWHSIPLRSQRIAQPVQTQGRNTRNTTSAYVQTRKPPVQPQAQTRYTTMQPAIDDFEEPELEEDDYIPPQRVAPRSAVKYQTGDNTPSKVAPVQKERRYIDDQGRDVYQQGNKRLVVVKRKPGSHWLLPAGLGMLAMVALMAGMAWFGNWYDNHQLYATYGFPRIWQTDANVGHGTGESHFIFENLNTHVFFEEIPGGYDFKQAIIYPVITLHGDNAANYPVTATFQDVNGDGKIDMLIHIGDQTDVFLNTGNGWKPEQ